MVFNVDTYEFQIQPHNQFQKILIPTLSLNSNSQKEEREEEEERKSMITMDSIYAEPNCLW